MTSSPGNETTAMTADDPRRFSFTRDEGGRE
jgi:hypothetical protein